jgi:hypothetical protein
MLENKRKTEVEVCVCGGWERRKKDWVPVAVVSSTGFPPPHLLSNCLQSSDTHKVQLSIYKNPLRVGTWELVTMAAERCLQ